MTLKELRIKNKVKQKEIALNLNKTRMAIAMYETGKRKPNIEQIPLLAKCLKTSIENIVLAIIETQNQNKKDA